MLVLLVPGITAYGDVSRVEISQRRMLESEQVDFHYEAIFGKMFFTLDPADAGNAKVVDIAHAPLNNQGLVEYSADFKLVVPSENIANGTLMYMVNNRGGGLVPPELGLTEPLSELGFSYLLTGWINELVPGPNRLRLQAPIVGSESQPVTGDVRYEVIVSQADNDVNIGGNRHLAYEPTEAGLSNATLSYRLLQNDPRVPLERSQFDLDVEWVEGANQPVVSLNLDGGFVPGYIYELIYEAKNPVLAGAGMAGIRDAVSLLRYGTDDTQLQQQIAQLGLAEVHNTVAYGNSQSGRLLRLYLYDGFNEDLAGRQVFDGVVPVIAGSGFGMFNNRFAMPTRTNGQHENQLFPNDLFPFTYGNSTDPFTGRTDGILASARASATVPKVMHIQTSNEYWVRAGSLPHTNPEGTEDADIPEEVRFYTIGGSQHGSGSGTPRQAGPGQLPGNPNMWAPFSNSLLVAMHEWVANGKQPPPSRYPKIADGTLVSSHNSAGNINSQAWNIMQGINHPRAIYTPGHADYGDRWQAQRIVDRHPTDTSHYYQAMVPAVNTDNNDFATSTVLPALTSVPLATFTPWNLRAPATGAETDLARLAGGYIPFSVSAARAQMANDSRNSISGLYSSFDEYLEKYEAATDKLIDEGYLLSGFKQRLMDIAQSNSGLFE